MRGRVVGGFIQICVLVVLPLASVAASAPESADNCAPILTTAGSQAQSSPRPSAEDFYMRLIREAYAQRYLTLEQVTEVLENLERGQVVHPFEGQNFKSGSSGFKDGFKKILAKDLLRTEELSSRLRIFVENERLVNGLTQEVQKSRKNIFLPHLVSSLDPEKARTYPIRDRNGRIWLLDSQIVKSSSWAERTPITWVLNDLKKEKPPRTIQLPYARFLHPFTTRDGRELVVRIYESRGWPLTTRKLEILDLNTLEVVVSKNLSKEIGGKELDVEYLKYLTNELGDEGIFLYSATRIGRNAGRASAWKNTAWYLDLKNPDKTYRARRPYGESVVQTAHLIRDRQHLLVSFYFVAKHSNDRRQILFPVLEDKLEPVILDVAYQDGDRGVAVSPAGVAEVYHYSTVTKEFKIRPLFEGESLPRTQAHSLAIFDDPIGFKNGPQYWRAQTDSKNHPSSTTLVDTADPNNKIEIPAEWGNQVFLFELRSGERKVAYQTRGAIQICDFPSLNHCHSLEVENYQNFRYSYVRGDGESEYFMIRAARSPHLEYYYDLYLRPQQTEIRP